eukprot:TRINITY_DN15836_c0_g1_i1.p1 TRINITY_DN15836_c0_g1~~TRINITY_DN15836_c0_g1_i1.p1  ORF type:complete len:655 (+),score=257.57 TRINITY_DN15836_c0_g1_i1:111-2075(+)
MAESSSMRRFNSLLSHISDSNNYNYNNEEYENGLETEDTCGIIGYVGKGNAVSFLVGGLRILENRGYDSAGISTITENKELTTTKFASSKAATNDAVDLVVASAKQHENNHIGIAHTRWATHGGKTNNNAHPHQDYLNRISLVHNGVIENYSQLKQELIENYNVTFQSETDTEVIANLISIELQNNIGMTTFDAVKESVKKLQGTWGLAVIDREFPDQIIAAKNGSPLLVGISKEQMFVASEASAFSEFTKEFIALEDGEVALIKVGAEDLDFSRIEITEHVEIEKSPAPFDHWTIKEIYDQPQALSKALNYGGRIKSDSEVKLGGLDQNEETLKKIDHLIIAACGTSYHAGLFGGKLMRSLKCFVTVEVIDAAELTREHFPNALNPEKIGLLVLSQSGETKDVHRCLIIAEEFGIKTLSIVNVVRSLIARTTKCGVYLNAGRENAVASTKAFTCQLVVLSLCAIWFSTVHNQHLQRRKELVEALHRVPTNVGMLVHRLRSKCKTIAESMINTSDCFILGKGLSESIAYEAALKIKEITYVHAEGYSGGALKHGPFALIENGTPLFLIILNDTHRDKMISALHEVHSRGARTIVITNITTKIEKADEIIRIPSNGPLTPLLAVIPFQLIAYELSILKNINPDRPRHLAKTVTVD